MQEIKHEVSFFSCLYLDEKNRLIIPKENLLAMIRDQGKKIKKTGSRGSVSKDIVMGCEILKDALIDHKMKDKPLEKWYKEYKFFKMVVINKSRVNKVRAILQSWSCNFIIKYDPSLIDLSDLQSVLSLGESMGCLDWRPLYGKYKAVLKK